MSDSRLLKLIYLINNNEDLTKLFRYNMMTRDVEFAKKAPWDSGKILITDDIIELKYYLAKIKDQDYPINLVDEAIRIVARRNAYNPLLDWLKSLEWDGIERLDRWLIEIAGAKDNTYIRDISRKVLCGAVKRIYEPGCKFDYMLIMEGDQGTGKSTLLSILGDDWYLDTHLSTSENKKDTIDAMRTAWIIEISDLAGFRKNDIEHLKSFISDTSDRVRMPYARKSEDYPRQCIFVGTHNPSGDNEYLKDDTGNRRFWPVECFDIDLEKMSECRSQLFAEAIVKYKQGEKLYIDNKESLKILDSIHGERMIETPLNGMIAEYIKNKNYVHNKEIIEKVFQLNPGKISFSELRSKCIVIGIFMRKLRWIRGTNEKRGWYFKSGHEFDIISEQEQEVWHE